MSKQLFLSFCVAMLGWISTSTASHILGADLSYRCLGNGQFKFTLNVYRDCVGIDLLQTSMPLRGAANATMQLVSTQDISPRCSGSSLLSCTPDARGTVLGGAVSKLVYTAVLNLSGYGAPPSSGLGFMVTLPCCRPALSNSNITEMTVSATMYRYADPQTGRFLTPAQMCDNSPVFATEPAIAYILNPIDTVYYQHFASDADGDQVVHQLDNLMDNLPIHRPFFPPYSISAPLPGMVGSGTMPIHPQTGEIVFRPAMTGNFATSVRASSYRNGRLVSEVIRDFAVKIVTAYTGSPLPYTTQGLAAAFAQRAPQIWKPQTQGDSTVQSFVRSFYAGDSIRLLLQSVDVFPTLSGDPGNTATWGAPNQQLKFAVHSSKLSTSNDAAVGCDMPPCATLNRLPITTPAVQPSLQFLGNGLLLGNGFSTLNYNGIELQWVPECNQVRLHDHGGGGTVQSSYGFVLRSADDMCVLEGTTDRAMLINILSKPVLREPVNVTLQFDENSRNFQLSWSPQIDTTSVDSLDQVNWGQLLSANELRQKSVQRRLQSFHSYRIYRQLNYGPWLLVGELDSIFQDNFMDSTVFNQSQAVSYQVRTVSGCNLIERASNRVDHWIQSTSLNDHKESEYVLFPNPGHAWYQIRAKNQASLPEKLELRDLNGALIHVWTTNLQTVFEFELHALAAGIYILQSSDGVLRVKLVHQP